MASLKDVKVGDEVVYVGLPFSAKNPPMYRIEKVRKVTAKRILCMGYEFDRETGKVIGLRMSGGRISIDPNEMKAGYAVLAEWKAKRDRENEQQRILESHPAFQSARKLLGLIGDLTTREIIETFDDWAIIKAAESLEAGKVKSGS